MFEEVLVSNSLSFVVLILIAALSGFFIGNSYSLKATENHITASKISKFHSRKSFKSQEKQNLLNFMAENLKSPQLFKEKPWQLTIRINYDSNPDPLSNFSLHLPKKNKRIRRQDSSVTSKLIEDRVKKYEKLLQNGHGARNFEVLSMLGKGGFGSVYKARHLLDEQIYAIKVIRIQVGINQNLYEHKAFREVLSMMHLNTRHVLRYYNCWLESEGIHNIGLLSALNTLSDNDSFSVSSSSSSLASLSEPYFQMNLNIQMEYSKGCTLKS